MADQKPTILFVDDKQSSANALRTSVRRRATVLPRIPADVTEADLASADLVVVDYELTEWEDRDAAVTSPTNGLALCGVLRERLGGSSNPKGVALYTGEMPKIAGSLPTEVRGYAVARLNNIEWVFDKHDHEAPTGIISLAKGVRVLPESWPEDADGAKDALDGFLGITGDDPFRDTAREDIDACHPPIHELSTATHALAVVRWLAHRVLPYPAFLLDRFGLAARLGVDTPELDRLLKKKSELVAALARVEYVGALSELFGKHWWRSGVDDLVFEWTNGEGSAEALRAAIDARASARVKFIEGDVVPVIDESYRAIGLAPVSTAVRLLPDDWPVFADEAWAERSVVKKSERLRGLVIPTDLELLNGAAS